MRASRVNWIAVTLIVVVQMVLAAVWYGVFAESWAASLGKTLADFAEPKPTIYLLPIGKALLGTAVLFQLLSRTGELTVAGGLKWAAFLWAGVVLPYDATHNTFSGFSPWLTLVDAGGELILLLVTGLVLGALPARAPADSRTTATA